MDLLERLKAEAEILTDAERDALADHLLEIKLERSQSSPGEPAARLSRRKLNRLLEEYRRGLFEVLGDDLEEVLLFGSYARGEARDGSDIDVLCVMKGPFDASAADEKTSELTARLCMEHDVLLSRMFATREDLATGARPFHAKARREARAI